MDEDNSDDLRRASPLRQSKKSLDAIFECVARSDLRSPLFWWLLEHHDELRQSAMKTRRGVTWKRLCADFPGMGVTLADGRPVTRATATRTWHRVRQEVIRLKEERANERAELEARRAADPRRNMPSRFGKTAPVGPPLSDVQPRPQSAPSVSINRQLVPVGSPRLPALSSTSAANESGDEPWRNMELPEALSKMRVLDWDGQILDLRQFFRDDGEPEPWEDPEVPEDERIGCLRGTIWSRAKEWARYRPYDRRFMKKW
ncbi:hypothetical protein GGD83_004720 [Rhodoblastus sphagnicola]|nr:hypothetical protein [Rhodoblastus sphagnicola]MBB4200891.1 hypothetical protein [Rhodoblastus sphagnicola]